MKVFLIRHGLSEANVDPTLYSRVPDQAIKLTSTGHVQADEAGRILAQHLVRPVRMWVSPYVRTRQTAAHVLSHVRYMVLARREHVLLSEQQFGLFSGHTATLLEDFPEGNPHRAEAVLFDKMIRSGHKFWARPPMGESQFDVVQRIQTFLNSVKDDTDIVVVAHDVVIRAFLLILLGKSVEDFDEDIPNCSVRLVDDGMDRGFLRPNPFPAYMVA